VLVQCIHATIYVGLSVRRAHNEIACEVHAKRMQGAGSGDKTNSTPAAQCGAAGARWSYEGKGEHEADQRHKCWRTVRLCRTSHPSEFEPRDSRLLCEEGPLAATRLRQRRVAQVAAAGCRRKMRE